jgi:hypothetical protein
MNLTPEMFLQSLKEGKNEHELNNTSDLFIDRSELKKLMSKRYGHTLESATEYLQIDYSNGFTICSICGSYYHLGKGFTKHLSNGCLHCEPDKHRVYFVNASKPSEGGFPARYMAVMFDNGMSYCKDELQIEKFKSLL